MSLQRKTPQHFEKLIIIIVFVPAKPKQTPQEWSMMEDSRSAFKAQQFLLNNNILANESIIKSV